MYELSCRYDSRNSFYGKAQVKVYTETQDNIVYEVQELYSYGTLVASITTNTETCMSTCEYNGKYSQTTTRHQKEFFKQYGLTDEELKELWKNGILEIRG